METSSTSGTATVLTRQQAKRMRLYFAQGARASKYELDGIDLDLIGFGLIETTTPHYDYTRITITAKGLDALHLHRQADIASRSVHHDFGTRVAAYLRAQGRITWENTEFKTWVEKRTYVRPDGTTEIFAAPHFQYVRPDVFSIMPSLQAKNINPCVHEVKVSRADFLGELAAPEKQSAYLQMSEVVYFAAPEGLIAVGELPPMFGLLVERENGEFKIVKRAKKRKIVLQPSHYLKMVCKPGEFPEGYRGA